MKKTLLCLFLLVAGIMNAQIVNIPDANFKSYLLGLNNSITTQPIDANGDGEIQVSEAVLVTFLNVSEYPDLNYTSLQGIEAFVNLTNLNVICDGVSEINLSAFSHLADVNLTGGFTHLDFSGLAQLNAINIYAESVTDIDLTGLSSLTYLRVHYSSLSALDLSGLTALTDVNITSSTTPAITWGTLPALTYVFLSGGYNGPLTSLNFSGVPNLHNLNISNFNLTSLDVSACSNLEVLQISDLGELQDLDLSSCPNINTIQASGNNSLTSFNLGNNNNLTTIQLDSQSLTNLDLSGCPNITLLTLSMGQMDDNSAAGDDVYINLKNGNISEYVGIGSNAAMSNYNIYVCIDEGEEESFQGLASNIMLSTYCSFTPGGDYNTITGTVSFDSDNNGCTTTDAAIPFSSVQINDGTVTGSSSASGGSYNFYTQAGTFTLTPQFENNYFTASTETVTFADNNNNTVTQNFCVTANGVHNDAEVIIVPILGAQPGFDADYKIVYKNKGNQTLSGDIVFTYDDTVLDYVSASPVEITTTTGSLTWNYTNLLPFESREIYVTLNVNSPMETPAVNIDDVLIFTVAITPATGDETPDDNVFTFNQNVIGSYDPNDITCLEGNAVSPDKIGEYLHYNINFENTGTAPATFVVVKDIIDTAKFDISSLQILNASHAVETRVTGNKVEFYFDNINLAANGGKGNVSFKIKSLNSLAVNSSVMQKADIYFDYNWPILTNEATTTFGVLNAGGFTKDATIKIYPNPAKNSVNINAESAIRSIQLYDVQGRLLEAVSANDITATLDVSSRANGIYFIKVTTDKGVKVEKLVKQ